MASFLNDAAHDALLNVLKTNVTTLYICSALPTTYAEASSTYKLGTKASPTLGAIGDGDTSGRKFTISAITDGVVDSAGTATHYALASGSVLYFAQLLASSLAISTGSPFTTPAFDIENPDPA